MLRGDKFRRVFIKTFVGFCRMEGRPSPLTRSTTTATVANSHR
jgi:hypothetical protein